MINKSREEETIFTVERICYTMDEWALKWADIYDKWIYKFPQGLKTEESTSNIKSAVLGLSSSLPQLVGGDGGLVC